MKPLRLLSLVFAMMLLACSESIGVEPSPPSQATIQQTAPTSTATAIPTAPSTPSPAPTVVPSATPLPTTAQTGLLPAPLYVKDFMGQLWRIEPDGTTRMPILGQQPAQSGVGTIGEYDLSPADGSLAYVLLGSGSYDLVRTDPFGKNPTTLLSRPLLSHPLWSPDGMTIALRIDAMQSQPSLEQPGIYLISPSGEAPRLLQPDDPVQDPANPPPEARVFGFQAWSSDGTRLLLTAFSRVVEGCQLMVKDIATGALTPLTLPEGLPATCGEGVWSRDGTAIYVTLMGVGGAAKIPGLWRADASTGIITALVMGEADGMFRLVHAPHQAPDGQLYAFMHLTDNPEAPPAGGPPMYTMYRIAAAEGAPQQIRDDRYGIGQVLWAPNGSGAVIVNVAPPNAALLWLPVDGGPAVTLPGDAGEMDWGVK